MVLVEAREQVAARAVHQVGIGDGKVRVAENVIGVPSEAVRDAVEPLQLRPEIGVILCHQDDTISFGPCDGRHDPVEIDRLTENTERAVTR